MTQTVNPPTAASLPAGHGVDRSDSSLGPSLPLARRGRLKNGNRSGDFLPAPRCGAHTRCGGECRQPAMANGCCRLHGGLSTGPRTPAGLARSRRARWKHGARSAEVTALRRAAATQLRRVQALLGRTRISAGHGVDRADSPATPCPLRAKVNRKGAKTPRCRVGGTSGTRTATLNALREQRSPHQSLLDGVVPASISNSASSCLCVFAVNLPSSAGHGLHRSVSQPKTIGVDPRSSAARPASPAGHGVHRSNSQSRPAASVWPSRRDRLRSSASICGLNYPPPAGHGVHRSFHDPAPLHRRPV